MEQFWLDRGVKPLESLSCEFSSLLDVIDQSCATYASNIAFSNIGHDITYGELDRMSHHFAAYLQSLPFLKQGDRIAIMAPNILAYPVASLGVLRGGYIVVNTNPLYTEREMLHQLKDSNAKVLIIFSGMAHKAQQILSQTSIEKVIVTELCELHPAPRRLFYQSMFKYIAKMEPAYHLPEMIRFRHALAIGAKSSYKRPDASSETLAMLQYTGGTTGVAKGAMLTHGNLLANLTQAKDTLLKIVRNGEEIVVSPLPLYHIYSFTVCLMAMMYTGNRSILITNPRNNKTFIKTLKKYPFTVFTGVNTLFVSLCQEAAFKKLDFSHLRMTLSGGMTLTKDAYQLWNDTTGSDIVEGYGLTETSPIVSLNLDGGSRFGSIGRPMDATEVKVVTEDGSDIPLGSANTPGELWVRGPQVMLGYWQRPDETKATITPDGWLKTGDVATIDEEGYMRIVDRKKDMIIVSGFNVYPNELEDVISQHPKILECAAIGIPNEKTGESIKLFVVAKDKSVSKEDIIQYSRKHLTGYKIPKFIEFKEDLPKTPVGKILRRELRDQANPTHTPHKESKQVKESKPRPSVITAGIES